jgi:cyanophycinase
MRHLFGLLALSLLFVSNTSLPQTPIRIKPATTKHGPEKGSLIIIGGGQITPEIWKKFTELAGGAEKANVVVVTAASGDSAAYNTKAVELVKRETGIKKVVLLHTSNLAEANSNNFIAPLRQATGVFFVGGRQWRIADSYLNTLTHQAFFDLLNREGVIAGTSAGATIQGSFLWRGDTSGPQVLVGDHTQGLAFLRNSVIDQHFLQRNRQFDLVPFIKAAPQLLGIALDESTAILIRKDTLEVIGKSYIGIYDYNTIVGKGQPHVKHNNEDYSASDGPFFFLHAGQRYDMGSRSVIKPQQKK